MVAEEEVLERLDRIAALLEIGFAEQIDTARTELRSDPIVATILDLIRDGWMTSGDIKRAVGKSANVSEKTVQRCLGTLATRGVIRGRGTGPSLSYRTAGLI